MAGYQEQELARQRAIAEELRQGGRQGVKGAGYQGGPVYMVGQGISSAGDALMGMFANDRTGKREEALDQIRQQEMSTWQQSRPSAIDPQTGQPKPQQQLAQETDEWLGMGAQSQNPAVLKMATKGLSESYKQPYKLNVLEETGKLKTELAAQKAASQMALLNQKIEDLKDRQRAGLGSREKIASDKLISQLELKVMELGAKAARQNKKITATASENEKDRQNPKVKYTEVIGADGKPKIVALPETMNRAGEVVQTGQTPVPTATGKSGSGSGGSAEEQKALIDQIDHAIVMGDKNPDAFGVQALMGQFLLDRYDPKGTENRTPTANISANMIHELSGAAVTEAERPRMERFIPSPTDNWTTAKTKLQGLKRMLEIAAQANAAGVTVTKEQFDDVDREVGFDSSGGKSDKKIAPGGVVEPEMQRGSDTPAAEPSIDDLMKQYGG